MHQDQEIKTTVLSGYQVAIQAGTVCKPDRAIHPAGLFSSSLLLCPFFSHSPLLEFPSLPPTTPLPRPPPAYHHFLTPVPKAFILKVSWWVCLNLESYLFILMPVSNYMYVCMHANGRRSVLVRYGHVVLVTCKTFQSMKYVVAF